MPEIRLLGPLQVRSGDTDLTPRRRKQRALLAALALRVGAPVTQDRLVDELWGENPPKTARHALENYVFELRKSLGKDVIETRPNGYLLNLPPEDVDVVRFERLIGEARAASSSEREDKLRNALSLIVGEPLADLAFEPFAQAQIARLQDLEVSAREELVEAELELGRHGELVGRLETLVAAHPFRERLRAHLMVALYRSGRQAEALEAYQDARRMLVDELGIDPSEELQELERAILRQDPSLRAPKLVPERSTVRPDEAPSQARAARKTVTIFRAELANSAVLAQRLDAEPLRAVHDRYLDAARTAVERHGGLCTRLGGDVVQAIFGVPAAHEDDALRAVRAAVELRERIGVLNDGLLPEHGVFLEVKTGVDTGEVLVQPDERDPATGRAVMGAEQLERMALPGQILLAEATHELVKGMIEAETLAGALEEGAPRAFRLVQLQPDTYGRPLRLDSPLVGRRRELAALSSAFERAVSDRTPHLFTLLGAAGVGKSRLVRELVESLADVASVLEGRCLPYGEGITYWPLLEAMRGAGVVSNDLEEHEITLETARRLLEGLARERPLALVLDDLQWAEPAFLDLVEQLTDASRGSPILIVCIARPELLDDRPTWGGGKPNSSSILIEALSEPESDRLIDNLLGESDLADPVRDYVIRASEGNPLFVEELLATLVEREILLRSAGRWTTTEVPAIPLPPTMQALVAARVDRLPAEERVVLELASVEGKVFDPRAVATLAGEELAETVATHLAALVRKELVRPGAAEERFSFRHQLIRDAAYGSMPMQTRADLHERLAGWLRQSQSARPSEVHEIVAYHRDQARRYRETLGLRD